MDYFNYVLYHQYTFTYGGWGVSILPIYFFIHFPIPLNLAGISLVLLKAEIDPERSSLTSNKTCPNKINCGGIIRLQYKFSSIDSAYTLELTIIYRYYDYYSTSTRTTTTTQHTMNNNILECVPLPFCWVANFKKSAGSYVELTTFFLFSV